MSSWCMHAVCQFPTTQWLNSLPSLIIFPMCLNQLEHSTGVLTMRSMHTMQLNTFNCSGDMSNFLSYDL